MDKRIVVDLDEETKRQFKAKVANEGKTIKDKLIEYILKYLNE